MALTMSEARAVTTLLAHLLDTPDDEGTIPSSAAGSEAAQLLAQHARDRLPGAVHPGTVAAGWRSSTPRLAHYDRDATDCPACHAVNDDPAHGGVCPYHAGVDDGAALLGRVVRYLAEDPDALNNTLADAALTP